MSRLRRPGLLLLVAVALFASALATESRSRAKLALDETPSHAFTQLAQCYPSTTPCHAGRVLGKRLAKSTAYFVVTQRGTFHSGLKKVKRWVKHAHKHHIDKRCLMKSFKKYYKKFYRRYKHRCPCRHHHKRGHRHHKHGHKHHHHRVGRHHRHHKVHHHKTGHHHHKRHHRHIKIHVHHRGHSHKHHHHVHHHKYRHSHHHKVHHRHHHKVYHHKVHHKVHHHKKHHKKRLSPVARSLAKTVSKTLNIQIKLHKKETKHFKKKELKWQKKLFTAKSLVSKTKCQAHIAHFKRKRFESVIKITQEKVRKRKVHNGGKCGCKALRKKLYKQIKKRNSLVRKEERAFSVSVKTVRKEIRTLHKRVHKADAKTKASLLKKIIFYKATKKSCNKHLHKARATEVRHKKHFVKSLARRIRHCKSSSKKEVLRAKLVKSRFTLQKCYTRRIAEKRAQVAYRQKSIARIDVRIKKVNKLIATSSGKKKIHLQVKLLKLETKKKVCKRVIKHNKKCARKFSKKAKKATRTHNAHFFKSKIETKRGYIRKWQTEYKQAKSKTMRRKCHRKILHYKRVVAVAKVKQLRFELYSAKKHHLGTRSVTLKLRKAEHRRTHFIKREISINRKHASHFRLQIQTLKKAKKEAKGTSLLNFKKKILFARVKLHSCNKRESKVIAFRVRVAKRDIKRTERSIARVTNVKLRVRLLATLKKEQKSYKAAIKCKTHHLKRKASRNIAKAKKLKHTVSILKIRISKAKGSEKTHLIKKLARVQAKAKVCKKSAAKEKKKVSKITKRAKATIAIVSSSCLPKIHTHHVHTKKFIKKTKKVEIKKVKTLKRLLKSATGHQKRSIIVRLVKHEKKLLKANKLQVSKTTIKINKVIRKYEHKIHKIERKIKHATGHKRKVLIHKLKKYEKKEKQARKLKKEIKIFSKGSAVTRIHKVHGCSCCGPAIKKVNAKIKAIQVSALEVENKYAKILIKKAQKSVHRIVGHHHGHHKHHRHHHVKHHHHHHHVKHHHHHHVKHHHKHHHHVKHHHKHHGHHKHHSHHHVKHHSRHQKSHHSHHKVHHSHHHRAHHHHHGGKHHHHAHKHHHGHHKHHHGHKHHGHKHHGHKHHEKKHHSHSHHKHESKHHSSSHSTRQIKLGHKYPRALLI